MSARQGGQTPRPILSEFNRLTATLRDPNAEAAYRRDFIAQELTRERIIWALMFSVYFLYGVLDLLTIREKLFEILTARWLIFTPIAIALLLLTFVDPVKRHSASLFTLGVFLAGISIVWMVSVMPSDDAPPYVIGVLVVFIFASCNVRMPFTLASLSFLLTTAAYSYVLLSQSRFTRIEIISGHFFMISSVIVAIITNYMQEVRLRLIWLRNKQSAENAKLIEELMIEATAADQSKINFLSVLSHELRTPLHQIIGFCEVSMKRATETGESEMQDFLNQIHTSAHKLLSQIAKMLRYADATAGKIRYHVEKCPVSELIESICVQAEGKAETNDINVRVGEMEAAILLVDPMNASYALGHIVENAINASKRGSEVIINGRKESCGGYLLEVRDFGVGMTPEKINLALAPFSQLESFRTRSSEGVGLGLALARKILNDQHAEITLVSEPGAGTTVSVRFAPAAESRGDEKEAA